MIDSLIDGPDVSQRYIGVALGGGKFRNVITLFGRKGKARLGYLDRLSPPLSDRPTRRPLSLEPTPRRLRQAHKGENRP